LTTQATHLWRLFKWGRTLARHGALGGIERDPLTPANVRRLVRVLRFGLRQSANPDYAAALQAIGPAAIKLGQALATRPDLVGRGCRGEPPPASGLAPSGALPGDPEGHRTSARGADRKPLFAGRRNPRRRRLDRPGPPRRHIEGRDVAIKVLRPGIEEEFASALETYEWAARHVELLGGSEAVRLRPRLSSPISSNGPTANSTFSARQPRLRAQGENGRRTRASTYPEIDWRRTARRVMTLEWLDGIKLSDRPALIAAGHDPKQLAAILVRAFLRQAVIDGFFHADLHQGNLFALPDGRVAAIDFGIMGRIDRRARMWLAEILYGLITGNYQRVAEIHFEAQYVPPPQCRRVCDGVARRRRADARPAGQGHQRRADAGGLVRDHPRLRHAGPAAPAAAPERRW
jgi:ubiquinone biosynthesis protein